jgi:prepilin-type N-terminal cleavage/methylation domain-containing protein
MKRNGQRGFTLVEMAIVLVIIGLILGAITIGKDVQRNAEYTKVKQKFIDQWVLAYNAHVQRTGVVVGDNQVAPTLIVNGANYTGPRGGDLTAQVAHKLICRGTKGPQMTADTETTAGFDLRDLMLRAGVRMPPGRAEGAEDRYVYLDTNGLPQEIQVCFGWHPPLGAKTTGDGAGNFMIVSGLTPDLARALDQMIDGKADAREGMFRQQGVLNASNNEAGVPWALDNKNNIKQTGVASVAGTNLDEDQIANVVAIYKMNQ